jgi:DNA-binding NarL/FixJ family response regulator
LAMKKKIKLALVDDQALFRKGMISLISEFGEMEIVIEAQNGKEFIDALKKEKPDVVLLDLEMPEMDGIEVTKYLHKKYPQIKIIILTMHDDEEFVLHLAENGAHGFLLKNSNVETVIDAIYAVIAGKYYFKEDISALLVKGLAKSAKAKPGFTDSVLTDREIEVVKLICKEFTNKEISEKMGISLRTVDGHRERILQRIGAHNTAGIVMYAVKHNLLD